MTEIVISCREDLDFAAQKVGLPVGESAGLSKEKNEWYVALRFLKLTIPFLFALPIMIRNGVPPAEPDFVIVRDGSTVGLFEITEATDKADRKEMALFQQSTDKAAMIGDGGGRFKRDKTNLNGGASNPSKLWATDIVTAIRRKSDKAILKNFSVARHLLIYPNSNPSSLLFDETDERDAINDLEAEIAKDRVALTLTANGCLIHVIGNFLICFDVLGEKRVLAFESDA